MPIWRAAWVMASTACPSATPGWRLNVKVAAGTCAWCDTNSGPTRLLSTSTRDDSGTAAPVSGDFT